MFTAQLAEGKLTLKNIKLRNGPKYGVQSYDGATVILDNVSITDFKYGGVLANGGKVEVKNLHLGYNGTGSNNGIEISKGASATNNPTLVMNGVLLTDNNENTIHISENDSLTDFTITNTENTTNKIVIPGSSVVLTDKNDNVIAESKIPEKTTPNVDIQKVIVNIVVNDKTYKITVNNGDLLTEEMLKSHIKIDSGYEVEGFYTNIELTNKFDFSKPVNAETTIFVKLSKIEEKVETETQEKVENTNKVEKDETPKTGVENYLGLAVITLLISSGAIVLINNKNRK